MAWSRTTDSRQGKSLGARVWRRPLRAGFVAHALALLGMTVLIPAPPVAAQTEIDPIRGKAVQDRVRPDYDPLGIRAGSFLINPEISLAETFTSNLYADETGERPDFITILSPKVEVNSDWGRHHIMAMTSGDFGFHANHGDEDYQDIKTDLYGRYDISRGTVAYAKAAYRRLHGARGHPDTAPSVDPTIFRLYQGELGFRRNRYRISAEVNTIARYYGFDDVDAVGGGEINNDDRDRTDLEGYARLGYEYIPGGSAFLQLKYDSQDYRLERDDAGYNRDSTGFRVSAGSTFDYDGIITGEVSLGLHQRSYVDHRFEGDVLLDVGAKIQWNPTELTTVQFGLDRRMEETTATAARSVVNTGAEVLVTHELRRNILLTAGLTYDNVDYRGIGRVDDVLKTEFGAEYKLNRTLFLRGRYGLVNRESNMAGEDYLQHNATLRMGAQW